MAGRKLSMAFVLAVAMGATAAQAHELQCEKTIDVENSTNVEERDGKFVITGYPAEVKYLLTVINVHPTEASIVLAAEDELLESLGFEFDPVPEFSIPVGQSVTNDFTVEIEDQEACFELAEEDGIDDRFIDNVFRVEWDSGEEFCPVRLKCKKEEEPPPDGGPTRTMGFYKTHPEALEDCLAAATGSIDLGFVEIDSVADALGLLWAKPSKFEDDTKREGLDKFRFLLGRQTLVAICNVELFGAEPTPSDLIDDALAALEGTDCDLIKSLIDPVDDFNNSADNVPLPVSYGPATPSEAKDLADDPTKPSGEVCE